MDLINLLKDLGVGISSNTIYDLIRSKLTDVQYIDLNILKNAKIERRGGAGIHQNEDGSITFLT